MQNGMAAGRLDSGLCLKVSVGSPKTCSPGTASSQYQPTGPPRGRLKKDNHCRGRRWLASPTPLDPEGRKGPETDSALSHSKSLPQRVMK